MRITQSHLCSYASFEGQHVVEYLHPDRCLKSMFQEAFHSVVSYAALRDLQSLSPCELAGGHLVVLNASDVELLQQLPMPIVVLTGGAIQDPLGSGSGNQEVSRECMATVLEQTSASHLQVSKSNW